MTYCISSQEMQSFWALVKWIRELRETKGSKGAKGN